jgi:hypothetical protein
MISYLSRRMSFVLLFGIRRLALERVHDSDIFRIKFIAEDLNCSSVEVLLNLFIFQILYLNSNEDLFNTKIVSKYLNSLSDSFK